MTLFASRDDLAARHSGATKWDRLLTALDQGTTLDPEIAHSIGDSLTYWRTTTDLLAHPLMTGHRRYETVLAVIAGTSRVHLARTFDLTTVEPYCDLSDRERFAPPTPGSSEVVQIAPGQILAIPINQAWQVAPEAHADLVIVHLTVEGVTFHNK